MDLADIQKAVLSLVLDPLHCKAYQRSLPIFNEGPKFFSCMRAGPFELEAFQNFYEIVGLVSEDHLEKDCCCKYSRADDSRWRELGYHFYNSLPAVAHFERVLPGNDNVFGLRNLGTQSGTDICYLSNLVMLPCCNIGGGDSNVDHPASFMNRVR